ncbi:hypothetical protein ABI59_00560 [Acidobacteria bacterium Mor1]|nr:hypothetical protein ABI59_00560 [Acidobacteria bacterium Mor1]
MSRLVAVRQDLDRRADQDRRALYRLKRREDWEAFRTERLDALRAMLRLPASADRDWRLVRTVDSGDVRIDCGHYAGRFGLRVTANRYRPATAAVGPGVLVAHSHHTPKEHGELQALGHELARSGCTVLIPDLGGHGERRQHPFDGTTPGDTSYRPERQDYYFRHLHGMALDLVDESLAGWMVGDLAAGLDLLDDDPSVDSSRIAVIGAVAGGGDLAAMLGAIDPRVSCLVPFNISGHRFVSDPDGSRCPPNASRDGFVPWVLLGAMAPRRLLVAQEFTWRPDKERLWSALQRVYDWYGGTDQLAAVSGKGHISGSPPRNSHCVHVGAFHREALYPELARFLDLPAPPQVTSDDPVHAPEALESAGGADLGSLAQALSPRLGSQPYQAAPRHGSPPPKRHTEPPRVVVLTRVRPAAWRRLHEQTVKRLRKAGVQLHFLEPAGRSDRGTEQDRRGRLSQAALWTAAERMRGMHPFSNVVDELIPMVRFHGRRSPCVLWGDSGLSPAFPAPEQPRPRGVSCPAADPFPALAALDIARRMPDGACGLVLRGGLGSWREVLALSPRIASDSVPPGVGLDQDWEARIEALAPLPVRRVGWPGEPEDPDPAALAEWILGCFPAKSGG